MNHPQDTSRKGFICQAFPEIKYYDRSIRASAKFKLCKEDLFPAIAGIQIKCAASSKSAPRTRAYQDTTAPHAP